MLPNDARLVSLRAQAAAAAAAGQTLTFNDPHLLVEILDMLARHLTERARLAELDARTKADETADLTYSSRRR